MSWSRPPINIFDRLSWLWNRVTHCRKNPHYFTAYGFDSDDYCTNCNYRRRLDGSA